MWIRSAYWIGQVSDEQVFRSEAHKILAKMKAMPGVDDVSLLWQRRSQDEGAPEIVLQMLIFFPSREKIEEMLAAPARAGMKPHAEAISRIFDGKVYHMDFEVDGG